MNEDIIELTEEDKQDILNLDEVTTFFLIDECGLFLFKMNHDLHHEEFPEATKETVEKDMVNIKQLQEFTVDNLGRFGVDPKSAKEMEKGDYWKWFKFWDKWKKNLTEDEWEKVSNGEYEYYLPKKTWKD